jgi:heptose-I-phosphate ethanolaminephosphotransferase
MYFSPLLGIIIEKRLLRKMMSKKVQKRIGESLLLLIPIFGYCMPECFFIPFYFLLLAFIACFLLIYGHRLFPSSAFLIRWLVGTCIYSSVILFLPKSSGGIQDIMSFPVQIAMTTILFAMLLTSFFLLLLFCLNAHRRTRIFRFFMLIVNLVFFLPPCIFWIYYFHAHALFSADTANAILQTYPAEAVQYLIDTITPVHFLFCLLLLAFFLLLSVWYTRTSWVKCPPPMEKIF